MDACALIALIQQEDGADIVENILVEAMDGLCVVSMHRLNLLEVYYGYLRTDGKEVADKHISMIENSCINISETITKKIMVDAGLLKTSYNLSLADTIALALAKSEQAVLVTSDHHELDAVEKGSDIDFLWIR